MVQKDLISREALTDRSEVLYQHTDSGKIIPWSAVRVCAINNAPAIDAVPVVYGRWIDRDGKTWCSECGASNKAYKPPFCPHCGARMDKEADNALD